MMIDEAIENYSREHFAPDYLKAQAYLDMPLPIGHDQTISQPTTVKRMLAWLDVRPGQKILDVGSGSGWTTALLSRLVGEKGEVHAVELVPELVAFGRTNCEKLGIKNVTFYQAGETIGLPDQAPFDRILVSAAASRMPKQLIDQLSTDGKLVVPVNDDIIEYHKHADEPPAVITHHGYRFVPLIT